MIPDTTSAGETKLYGLYIIIAIQVIALLYLLIDNFFVTNEPENAFILVVSGIVILIVIGLFLRNNPARLAMIAFGCISIAGTAIGLVTKMIAFRSVMSSELFAALLVTNVIPLGFTVWVVVYLTRQDVRRHFVAEKTEVEDVSLSS